MSGWVDNVYELIQECQAVSHESTARDYSSLSDVESFGNFCNARSVLNRIDKIEKGALKDAHKSVKLQRKVKIVSDKLKEVVWLKRRIACCDKEISHLNTKNSKFRFRKSEEPKEKLGLIPSLKKASLEKKAERYFDELKNVLIQIEKEKYKLMDNCNTYFNKLNAESGRNK